MASVDLPVTDSRTDNCKISIMMIYIHLVLCYSYLPIGTCIYTPGFVLFILAYWYLYIYAWFCAILTCVLVLVYSYTPGFVLFILAYWYLYIYTPGL